MAIRSADVFARHFSEESLQEIIDLHLKDGVARGVDGTGYERFLSIRDQEVQLIAQRASEGRYKFSPYRQKLILKNAISPPRQVSIPTLRDRVALRALNNCLTEIFPDCRPQHAHPVISSVLNSVREMTDADCFIKLDVRSFYDEVNHSILMRNVRQRIRCANPLSLIEGAITTPTGTTVATRAKNSIGIPQGLSISNLLSSIYLKSIDEKYGSMLGLKYHRYVDDILCIAPASEAEDISRELIKRLKTKKKLRCHPLGSGKSMISDATNDITYLGYLVSKMKISVRSATEKKLMTSIMEIIFGATTGDQERAIWRINLRITGCKISGSNVGWMFYFSQITDLSLLAKMDAQIQSAVKRQFGTEASQGVKRLLKSYHQVKYHHRDSSYFPDFATYSRDEMENHLNLLAPGRYRNLSRKTDAEISRIFGASVWREVKRMERDTLGGFS